MTKEFKKASKKKQKLRLLLEGASGSGKTYSALLIAKALSEKLNKRIAFIDTEFGSASLYADRFDFDALNLKPPFTPNSYVEAIESAASNDYGVLIIDSISHEWSGQGGCLDIHASLGGRFNDWQIVTPKHKKFIDAILMSDIHIIGCARTKSDYIIEEGINKSGKATSKPTKVGTKTEQREGLEFEFTTIFRLNQNHIASVSKDRTSLFEGIDEKITEETGCKLLNWLNDGEEPELKSDADLYVELAAIVNITDLKKYYEENKDNVNDKLKFHSAVVERQKELSNEI